MSDSGLTKLVATALNMDPGVVKIQTTLLSNGNRIRTIRADKNDVVEVITYGGDAPVWADSRVKIATKISAEKATWEAVSGTGGAIAVKSEAIKTK